MIPSLVLLGPWMYPSLRGLILKETPWLSSLLPVASLTQPDVILLTHSHRDHFDEEAAHRLAKDTPFFCQPPDLEKVQQKGFKNVTVIEDSIAWEGIEIIRTGGKHGTGAIGMAMGPVSGYVLRGSRGAYCICYRGYHLV